MMTSFAVMVMAEREREREGGGGCQEKQKLGVQVFQFFVNIFFWEKNVKKEEEESL